MLHKKFNGIIYFCQVPENNNKLMKIQDFLHMKTLENYFTINLILMHFAAPINIQL